MALGSTQSIIEMSTRNLPGGQPHRHLWADCLKNVEASTPHNPMGLHGMLQGLALPFTVRSSSEVTAVPQNFNAPDDGRVGQNM
jgi:hypothetical protein